MIGYDFEKSVSYWVGLTSHLFKTILNNELAGSGVTIRQVRVLGWIERCGAPQDLRKKIVRLTETITATWAHIVERGERMETRATAGLSPGELENLKKTLATMRRNL